MREVRKAMFLGLVILHWVGLAWGGPLGDLIQQGGFGNARFGALEGEVSASGGAQATWAPVKADVLYVFKEGRLFGIQFTTTSLNTTSELHADLGQVLGKTYNESDYQQPWVASTDKVDLRWEGDSTGGGVLLVQAKEAQVPAPGADAAATPAAAATAVPEEAPVGLIATLLKKGEFRGIALGASLDSFEDLQPSNPIGGLDTYIRTEEDLRFEGLILTEITYTVQGNAIIGIGLHAEEGDDSVGLARAIAKVMGKPSGQDQAAGSVSWSKAPVDVTMQLLPNGAGSIAMVTRTKEPA